MALSVRSPRAAELERASLRLGSAGALAASAKVVALSRGLVDLATGELLRADGPTTMQFEAAEASVTS